MKEVKNSFYCCNTFWDYVEEEKIEYDPILREYIFYIKDKNIHNDNKLTKSIFFYCPYCGTKLPKNLEIGDEYYDALEEAVGKEFCDIKDDEIPEEFKSDEWWKKRGL